MPGHAAWNRVQPLSVDRIHACRFTGEEMRALHHTDDWQYEMSETADAEARLPVGTAILVIAILSAFSWGVVISLAMVLREIL